MKYIAPAVTAVHDALALVQGGKEGSPHDSNGMSQFSTSAAYEADE